MPLFSIDFVGFSFCIRIKGKKIQCAHSYTPCTSLSQIERYSKQEVDNKSKRLCVYYCEIEKCNSCYLRYNAQRTNVKRSNDSLSWHLMQCQCSVWFIDVSISFGPSFYFCLSRAIVNHHVSLRFSFCIFSHCSRSIVLAMLFSKNGAYPIHWFSVSLCFVRVCALALACSATTYALTFQCTMHNARILSWFMQSICKQMN